MTNSGDRLDRIGGILERVSKKQEEMAARQQYHDEAFERHDAELKLIREAIAANSEIIQAQLRNEEAHDRRRKGLEGGAF
jgi:C4-type Zn-finger protein